jgi:hypothetical protein
MIPLSVFKAFFLLKMEISGHAQTIEKKSFDLAKDCDKLGVKQLLPR